MTRFIKLIPFVFARLICLTLTDSALTLTHCSNTDNILTPYTALVAQVSQTLQSSCENTNGDYANPT